MITLIMTDHTLLHGGHDPAHLQGHGPVPAGTARQLIADQLETDATDHETSVFLRRLYTHPRTRALVAMESRSRKAPPGLSRLLRIRDQHCREPWCDAPIRHDDHIHPHSRGGATSEENMQSLCEACNYAKTAPGWTAEPTTDPGGRHTVTITTPTGHHHTSTAPNLPGTSPPEPAEDRDDGAVSDAA